MPTLGVREGVTLASDGTVVVRSAADPSPSWGLSAAWFVRPDGWLEVLFDRQTLEFRGESSAAVEDDFDVVVDYVQLGGGYEPRRRGASPYVAVALGLTHYEADPAAVSESVAFSGSIAGGVKIPMGRRALFRIEGRGWGTFTETDVAIRCGPGCQVDLRSQGWGQVGVRAGVALLLGKGREPRAGEGTSALDFLSSPVQGR